MEDEPRWVEALWPPDSEKPHLLRVWYRRVNGRPAVVGVEMWGVEPVRLPWITPMDAPPVEAAITAEEIRLPLGAILDGWVSSQWSLARGARSVEGANLQQIKRFEEKLDGKRTGRPRLSDDFLTKVARVYRKAVADGDRAPAKAVQRALGAEVAATARSWVRQARKRGFLEEDVR